MLYTCVINMIMCSSTSTSPVPVHGCAEETLSNYMDADIA